MLKYIQILALRHLPPFLLDCYLKKHLVAALGQTVADVTNEVFEKIAAMLASESLPIDAIRNALDAMAGLFSRECPSL